MKTSKKQFELFKDECEYWIGKFEMNEWLISIFHERLDDNAEGECRRNFRTKTINIVLNTHMDAIDEELIKETAKHECIHALIGRFSGLAQSRFVSVDELRESEEELIRKLEKIIKQFFKNWELVRLEKTINNKRYYGK